MTVVGPGKPSEIVNTFMFAYMQYVSTTSPIVQLFDTFAPAIMVTLVDHEATKTEHFQHYLPQYHNATTLRYRCRCRCRFVDRHFLHLNDCQGSYRRPSSPDQFQGRQDEHKLLDLLPRQLLEIQDLDDMDSILPQQNAMTRPLSPLGPQRNLLKGNGVASRRPHFTVRQPPSATGIHARHARLVAQKSDLVTVQLDPAGAHEHNVPLVQRRVAQRLLEILIRHPVTRLKPVDALEGRDVQEHAATDHGRDRLCSEFDELATHACVGHRDSAAQNSLAGNMAESVNMCANVVTRDDYRVGRRAALSCSIMVAVSSAQGHAEGHAGRRVSHARLHRDREVDDLDVSLLKRL